MRPRVLDVGGVLASQPYHAGLISAGEAELVDARNLGRQ